MQIILVNCDRSEEEYNEHLKEMPWISAIPFEASEVVARMEDMAEAEVLPKLSIINIQKSIQEVTLKDVKNIVVKHQNMSEAVTELKQEILNAF